MRQILKFLKYKITKNGEVWSCKSQKFLKPTLAKNGYSYYSLYINKKRYYRPVHRLVLETFVGKCPKGMECCHNNCNKQDNRLENLRWDTRSNNIRDSVKYKHFRGENRPNAKLTEQDVRMIIYMYKTGEFTQTVIADIYGVSHPCISFIISRKNWKHIWSK